MWPRSPEDGECEPAEIHESVTRRDERGQVLEAIAVETPDQGADDFPERRNRHDRKGLQPDGGGLESEKCGEHARGEYAKPELPRSSDLSVQPQTAKGPDGDDEENEGRATHVVHLRRTGPRGSWFLFWVTQSSSTNVTSMFT